MIRWALKDFRSPSINMSVPCLCQDPSISSHPDLVPDRVRRPLSQVQRVLRSRKVNGERHHGVKRTGVPRHELITSDFISVPHTVHTSTHSWRLPQWGQGVQCHCLTVAWRHQERLRFSCKDYCSIFNKKSPFFLPRFLYDTWSSNPMAMIIETTNVFCSSNVESNGFNLTYL